MYRYESNGTFEVRGDKAYFDGLAEAGYMQIKGGKLYRYYTEDEDGYCEMYERIKGFREN